MKPDQQRWNQRIALVALVMVLVSCSSPDTQVLGAPSSVGRDTGATTSTSPTSTSATSSTQETTPPPSNGSSTSLLRSPPITASAEMKKCDVQATKATLITTKGSAVPQTMTRSIDGDFAGPLYVEWCQTAAHITAVEDARKAKYESTGKFPPPRGYCSNDLANAGEVKIDIYAGTNLYDRITVDRRVCMIISSAMGSVAYALNRTDYQRFLTEFSDAFGIDKAQFGDPLVTDG